MSGAIHPLPPYGFMAWYLVKTHRDNFTFYLYLGWLSQYGDWLVERGSVTGKGTTMSSSVLE
jgi:hypothetical protein